MIEALFLAIALAMDAFAVALAQGARFRPRIGAMLAIATAFGFAQGAMAGLGWALGELAFEWIAAFAHWIAFGLLVAIGALMLRGSSEVANAPLLTGSALFSAAIATSIDALAGGVSLPMLAVEPLLTVALIAGVTLLLSLCGVKLGKLAGDRFGRSAEVLGGVVLIGLGCQILAEHAGFF
jgi:putative Mn2+ efflux pump MntP